MRHAATICLLVTCSGCGLAKLTAEGVGSKVAVSKALDNRGSPQNSRLVHGFLERQLSDLWLNAVVIATDMSGDIVSVASVGRQGYYTLFVPPGTYRLTAYVDRDSDGTIVPSEIAGQISTLISVPNDGDLAYFGLDIAMTNSALSDSSGLSQALDEHLTLDEGIPSIERSDDLFAPVYSQENIKRGTYESTTSFFNYASPIQHLDEVDLTAGRIPIIFVHGIDDSPQIFDFIEKELSKSRYEPLFFYYPSGSRLPAMAELFYHLFLSGQVLPTFDHAALIAHSMGGLVARGSLNFLKDRPGESTVDFYGSAVSPYGGVFAAEMGIKTGPVVVPSWMDIAPKSDYLTHLFAPLPPQTTFSMINGNADTNSDGVITLVSQRRKAALAQATHAEIFPQTHVGIMSDPEAVRTLLSWVDAAFSPKSAPEPQDNAQNDVAKDDTAQATTANEPEAQQPLEDLERISRAHQLRVALVKSFAEKTQNVLVSTITPTVVRLRIYNERSSLALQLSVGQGIRIDVPAENQAIFERAWPSEALNLDLLATEIVALSQQRLYNSTQPPQPAIPLALRYSTEDKTSPSHQKQTAHISPPPVVFASGIMVAGAINEAVRMQIPFKMDGYFGHFGMGLDLRYTPLAALSKTSTTSVLYEPWLIGGGFRLRLGHSLSLFAATIGLSGGIETGRARVYGPDIKRFSYKDDDLLKKERLLSGLIYGSGSFGVRIHEDFYAIGMGELGWRFSGQSIKVDEDISLDYPSRPFFSGMLGVEVRVP